MEAVKKDTEISISLMRCDGGAVRDGFLMQFQSDILNIPLQIPSCTEATARGAAFAAAIGCGMADILDAEKLFEAEKRYTPEMSSDERERLQNDWHRAVERAVK
jgi:glycerol kinase